MVCFQSQHSVGVVTIDCLQCFPDMPYPVWYLLCFSLFSCMCSRFLLSIMLIILHGLLFICFLLYSFLSLILHGVCIIGIMGYVLVGGLILLFIYHHLCISCCPYGICSYIFFLSSLLCFVCLFLYSHMPLVFLLPFCVCFLHTCMKTFGWCVHMHFIICIHMWILKYVYLTYFFIFNVISQAGNVMHVIF